MQNTVQKQSQSLYRRDTISKKTSFSFLAFFWAFAVQAFLLLLVTLSSFQTSLAEEPQLQKGITFWLLAEENGNWRIPLPNWSVDDIMRTINYSTEKGQERPYTIQSINANGRVENGIARLTIQYRIFTNSNSVVRVPLGLNEGVYISSSDKTVGDEKSSDIYNSIKYTGPSAYNIEFDKDLNGYVAVFQNYTTGSERSQIMSLKQPNPAAKSEPSAQTPPLKTETPSVILPDLKLKEIEKKPADKPIDKKDEKPTQLKSQTINSATQVPQLPSSTSGKPDASRPTNGPIHQLVQKPPMSIQLPNNKKTTENKNNSSVKGVSDRSHFLNRINAEFSGNQTRRGLFRHTLTLTLCFPVETTENNEYRLKATFPPAVSGKIRLEVPIPDVQFTATQGIMAMPPVTLSEKSSEIILNGMNRTGEPTEIIWSRKENRALENRVVLQVEDAEINVVPSLQNVQLDVTLPVRLNGGETDLFRIRVPNNVQIQKESLIASGPRNAVLDIRSVTEESSETKPNETKPNETKPNETKPNETKPNETKPNETKPNETKPNETKPNETKPNETKPNETKPNETKPNETKPNETKPNETKPNETKPNETKPNETKPNETKPNETKPNETKPNETKPNETKPNETKPNETKPTTIQANKPIVPPKESRIIEIRLARRQSEPITFRFKAIVQNAEQMKHQSPPSWHLEGFELLGAQKQYGRIKFMFPKDLTFKAIPNYGVRANPVEEESPGQEMEQYLFYAQPFSMDLHVLEQQTRIKVKPEYQFSVGREEVRLHAQFQFTIYGSKVRQLALKMEDWFVSEAKSNYLVDNERLYEDPKTGEFILPLTAASEGQINIELKAVRKIKPNEKKLKFKIPVPVADWIESGPVIIIPDDNIELTPVMEETSGLRPSNLRSLTISMDWPSQQQQPMAFSLENRDNRKSRGEEKPEALPDFTAELKFHTRQTDVRSEAVVSFDSRDNNVVRQTLIYQIKYEPLESITLSVPADLQDPTALKILVDGKPVADQNIISEAGQGIAPNTLKRKLMFSDKPHIGECVVTLVYPRKVVELLPQLTNKIVIDLVQPMDGTMQFNQISVIAPSGVNLETAQVPDGNNWTFNESNSSLKGEIQTYQFNAEALRHQIVLKGIINARDVFGTTLVERSWIQTWLVNSTRLDRIVYRIVSDQPQITIKLPLRVRRDRVSFKMNGKAIYLNQNITEPTEEKQTFINEKDELIFSVPDDYRIKPLLIELSWIIDLTPDTNTFEVDFPKFIGSAVTVRRTYWQVILPSDRHLIGGLPDWSSEFARDLVWNKFYWQRQPALEQNELASWIGIPAREKLPSGANCYLFSSFHAPKQSQINAVERPYLILFGSGLALIIGFGFIYVPLVRHRGILLIFLVGLLSFCSWNPSGAIVLIQSTVFGIILTILTLVLSRLFGARQPIRSAAAVKSPERVGSSFENQPLAWPAENEEIRQ